MELVCPSGSLPAVKAAVDNGADAVYLGFRDATNARHFAGLNFENDDELTQAIRYARTHQVKVFVAINTYPQAKTWALWQQAVDRAAQLEVDALIAADLGVIGYAHDSWPELNLHLSVQGSATSPEALSFHHRNFGIKRAVLPRVLSLKQVAQVAAESPVDLEVFGFGSLCIMAEGRCLLSSYLTDQSPNTFGACSPAHMVRWQQRDKGLESRLNGVLIDRFQASERAGYPTLCKGRFVVGGSRYNVLEEPVSLNTLDLIPELDRIGIKAIKIEGRQRSPAYVAQVVSVWRRALDSYASDPSAYKVRQRWQSQLSALSEGNHTTLGAYHRPWH